MRTCLKSIVCARAVGVVCAHAVGVICARASGTRRAGAGDWGLYLRHAGGDGQDHRWVNIFMNFTILVYLI